MAELTQLIKQKRLKAVEYLMRKKLEQEPENVYFLAHSCHGYRVVPHFLYVKAVYGQQCGG